MIRLNYLLATLSLLLSTSMAIAATPKTFEYSWDGFSNTAGVYSGEEFSRRQYYTSSGNTGPNGGAEGSQWFIYLETSSGSAYYSGNYATLESSTTTARAMSFYYHMYGADIGTLAVEVYNGYVWERIWELSGEQQTSSNDDWRKIYLDLSGFTTSKKIRFKAVAVGGYRGDIGIDHVTFEDDITDFVRYHYDTLNRLICTEDSVNGDREYSYDAAGNRSNVNEGDCNE